MGRKVLVVDDEPLVPRRFSASAPVWAVSTWHPSSSSMVATTSSTEEHIDILLADINMPGLDGRKLSLPVQGCNGDLETVPVKLLRTLPPHKVILTELARPIVVSRAPSFST